MEDLVTAARPGLAQPSAPCRLLFRDEWFAGCYKPSGVTVHRTAGARRAPALLQWLRDRLGTRVYPVHRLDRGTSGIVVMGLTSEAAGRLCALFRDGLVSKRYVAVVRGWPAASGVIDHPVPSADGKRRLPARTWYRTLFTVELPLACGRYPSSRYAMVEILPETGRYHQIRRHLKHISHPIVGDTQYGQGSHNRLFRRELGLHRLLLQAVSIRFRHPFTDAATDLSCPVDADLYRPFAQPPS